jgi:hypothetical protein
MIIPIQSLGGVKFLQLYYKNLQRKFRKDFYDSGTLQEVQWAPGLRPLTLTFHDWLKIPSLHSNSLHCSFPMSHPT